MKCSFCGNQIIEGTGMMFVYKTGKRHYFCSTKCEKNLLKLHRKPAGTKWTEFHRSEKGKVKKAEPAATEMVVPEKEKAEEKEAPKEEKQGKKGKKGKKKKKK